MCPLLLQESQFRGYVDLFRAFKGQNILGEGGLAVVGCWWKSMSRCSLMFNFETCLGQFLRRGFKPYPPVFPFTGRGFPRVPYSSGNMSRISPHLFRMHDMHGSCCAVAGLKGNPVVGDAPHPRYCLRESYLGFMQNPRKRHFFPA